MTIWWCISFFVLFTVSVKGYNSYGVVQPHDPYVFVGHDLKITCNITTVLPESSGSLFFTKSNIVIPKQYIQILSSRSIQLTLPIISPDDAGNYVCKLNRTGGYSTSMGNQLVTVEYEPKKVKSITCTVFNWESLTCSWDLGVNYVHLDHINVQLAWTVSIDRTQHDCPHLTMNSCTWKAEDAKNSFHPNMMYYMVVIVTNTRTTDSKQSKVFRIDSQKIVKPSSVSDLRTSHNSTCFHLKWNNNKKDHAKIYRIQYQPVNPKWESKFKELRIEDVTEKTICSLIPSTMYKVKISCKPLWDGYWSEDEETVITLDDDVPGAAPEIQPGGFVEKECAFKGCRRISVYWRPIIRRLANGEIINYKVTARETDSLSPVKHDDTGINTSGQLMLRADQDYFVDVQGQTKIGLSPHKASILILAKNKKPLYPSNFLVEATPGLYHNALYRLHIKWSQPRTTRAILGYTLFWCTGTRNNLDCEDPLVWAVLNGDNMEYTKYINKNELTSLMFGISMEMKHESGETVSSGILWNECIYMHNERPLLAPKNVRILQLDEQNGRVIHVEWDKFKCSETRGYITQYNVYYCQAEEGQNCSGTYNVVHVDGHDTMTDLKELSDKATYRVWIKATSAKGPGPESEPVYTTIPGVDHSLTTEEIAWIVIGCLLVVVLSMIGFIFLFRKCAVEVKEQFKPYDDLPNVPLPPIPMIRPSSATSKSPDSEDDIYSKIPDRPISPSSSPDSMSIYSPLISQSESQDETYDRRERMFVKLPERNLSSIASPVTLFTRLKNSIESQASQNQDSKNFSTFRPRPKRCSKGLSYSADMLSGEVSPYGCVDVVQCPNSEKISRKHIPSNKQCHSVGSMVNDPTYETNNLSLLSDGSVENPPVDLSISSSREHFNIQIPLDRGKGDVNSDTLNSCTSNEINSVNDECDQTQETNEMPEDKIASFVRKTEMDEKESPVLVPPDVFVQETWPKCSNNNDISVSNNCTPPQNITELLPNPNIVTNHGETTYKKELNIRPGPRPVSEVINLPPHFYGSLSLLDSGDATEL